MVEGITLHQFLMPSGQFSTISPEAIIVLDRQRIEDAAPDIEELADSIARLGLLNPIMLTREHVLIHGFRRFRAVSMLGWTAIPFQYEDSTDLDFLFLQEFEENEKRKDFTMLERATAIERYHTIRSENDSRWSHEKTAAAMGIKQPTVTKNLKIAEYKDNAWITEAKSTSEAYNRAIRIEERKRADSENVYSFMMNAHIHCQSFLDWAPAYSGPKFNLIHCDFPYGINAHKHEAQHSTTPREYDDSPEIFFELLRCLTLELDGFCAPSAHIIFWFPMSRYCETWELLKLLDGFQFDEYPLVWQRGLNEGIAPDPQRRPRRIYETAFFGWRNDRKLVRTKANCYMTNTTTEIHPHEKPLEMLTHFLEMCVDENTAIFDPTCGSGTALRAAKALGASRWFGLETNQEYADAANRALHSGG